MLRQRGSVALVEDVLGCKWTLELLGALARGLCRPAQLRRAVPGISVKVLNERLTKLRRFGVVERRALPSRRLHVEYRLTPKGRELARLMARILAVCARWDGADAAEGAAHAS
jgi:DNA-binding HxlR family transcriptional regulator